MTSIIRIKRSAVSGNPTTLAAGELAYSSLNNNTSGNRLYVGTGTETAGDAANHEVIGGTYFTDMLDHSRGTLTALSALITDSNSVIDAINAGNISITGNTITTTNTNGDLLLATNGSGSIDFSGTPLTGIGTPTDSGDIATKGYVDNQVGGVTFDFDGDSGTDTFSSATGTLSFNGGSGIFTKVSDDTLTIDFTNDSFTLGSTTVALGSTITALDGLTQINVDNIRIDGNVILSTNTDGNINMNPNGEGTVVTPAGYTGRTGFGSNSLVPKSYVDGVSSGLDVKQSVRVATTTNINISTDLENGDTLDGVTLATDDRVLVKDQTDQTENGIYVVVASGVASRSTDADEDAELSGGSFTFVEEGTTNGDNGFVFTHNGTPTLGSTNITISQFSGAGNIDAGAGLVKSGSNLYVNVDSSTLEISGDEVIIKDGGVTNAKLQNSSFTFNGTSVSLGTTHTITSDSINEGTTNLYFSDERVDDRVNALLIPGEGIDLTYVDGAGTLTVAAEIATVSNAGVANFDSNQFTLTAGLATINNLDGGTY